MPRRRQRFGGAGGAATREFKRRRRENFRDEWTTWLLITAAIGGFAAWSLLTGGGLAGRALAAMAGVLIGLVGIAWSIGGHVSAVRWLIGAAGERETAKQIEKLGAAWHCEHDLEQPRGNWDHVLVGPPGVFLLDSKSLSGTVAAGGDALRAGRVSYRGGIFRSSAKQINQALEGRLGSRAPVVYLRGDQLVPWLSELSEKVNAPQRAALVTALQEVAGRRP